MVPPGSSIASKLSLTLICPPPSRENLKRLTQGFSGDGRISTSQSAAVRNSFIGRFKHHVLGRLTFRRTKLPQHFANALLLRRPCFWWRRHARDCVLDLLQHPIVS